MKHAEGTGRTVDGALGRALAALGASRDDVDVEILDPGARGVLGLGARDARVRVSLKAGPEPEVLHIASQLLRLMGYEAAVRVREQAGLFAIEIEGEHLGALIGRRGTTLASFELLLGLMLARQTKTHARVVVDIAGYRARRRLALEDLARRMADRALREGLEVPLDPMDAAERRIIHTTLSDHPKVYTYSRGEAASRRVVIAPRSASAPVTRPPDSIGA